jgi:phosphohistidine swiveling domain-containing protein
VNNNAISKVRLVDFRRSIVTVAGEMSQEFNKVLNDDLSKESYFTKFGHLRPSSYDILSPNYSKRLDLFDGEIPQDTHKCVDFKLTKLERSKLNILLGEHGITNIDANELFEYSEKAIRGREYAKFIFTKHLSDILEYVADWGTTKGFTREQLSMLSIDDIIEILYSPLKNDVKEFYEEKIKKAIRNFDIASSFKLSYLIRSVRDVHIVPMQRSLPNFIGIGRVEAPIIVLEARMKKIPDIKGKIVCIEGADPGYDWIFTRNIAGLITKYGGTNSHMAIRSAEYNIPAAIGCGEQTFARVVATKKCLIDCQGQRLNPVKFS